MSGADPPSPPKGPTLKRTYPAKRTRGGSRARHPILRGAARKSPQHGARGTGTPRRWFQAAIGLR
eukprot:1953106-Rhodomonas_salina.5